MRPAVAIDTALIAIPNSASSSGEVEEIFHNISAWANLAESQNCCEFAICSNALEVLGAAGCYPATPHIEALLDLYNLAHVFSPKDINSRILSLISRSISLFEAFQLEVTSCQECKIEDVDFSGSPDSVIAQSTCCMLATLCLANRPDLIRAALGFPSVGKTISVKGTARIKRDAYEGWHDYPAESAVDGHVIIVRSPSELLSSLSCSSLWEHMEDEIQCHMAISLEVVRLAQMTPTCLPVNVGTKFCIGTRFLNSLRAHQAFGDDQYANVVRQKCAQLVIDFVNSGAVDFGTVRISDGAVSFRMHVTKHHQGLRLMFWRRSSGLIELSNIGNKFELAIESGDYTANYQSKFLTK